MLYHLHMVVMMFQNAIGPFTALRNILVRFTNRKITWILVGGGVGIELMLLSNMVIKSWQLFRKYRKINLYNTLLKISTALTEMATQLGLSVKSNNCLIGAITIVLSNLQDKINKATIKKIIMFLIVTLPASHFLVGHFLDFLN